MRDHSLSMRSAAAVGVLAAATLAAPTLTAVAQAGSPAKPGLLGSPTVLQDQAEFGGWDVGEDASGTAYIGWIASPAAGDALREVHLCTLPPGATTCAGGVQSVSGIDPATASGLRLVVTSAGLVTLVWSHEATAPAYTGRDGRIAEATSQSGGPLSAPQDVADAPSYDVLEDAVAGPGGAIWTAVGGSGSGFELREGVTSAAVTVAAPYEPGSVNIAFHGATPVIAIQRAGAITLPVSTDTALGPFTPVAKTWTASANIGLVATGSGIRLIASESGGYRPIVSKYTGSGFSSPTLLGDSNACPPSSHDVGTDASGRVLDISDECDRLAVANLANTTRAGIVRFAAGGSVSAGPAQVASTPRGHAIAVWSIESPTHTANRLVFGRVLLPGLATSVSRAGVTVSGPASCQPASTIAVSVRGAKAGWKVSSASLTFGGRKLRSTSTIDGSKLKAGKLYALVGTVVFTHGHATSRTTATLKFRSCSNP
jgi:hypothetical protein